MKKAFMFLFGFIIFFIVTVLGTNGDDAKALDLNQVASIYSKSVCITYGHGQVDSSPSLHYFDNIGPDTSAQGRNKRMVKNGLISLVLCLLAILVGSQETCLTDVVACCIMCPYVFIFGPLFFFDLFKVFNPTDSQFVLLWVGFFFLSCLGLLVVGGVIDLLFRTSTTIRSKKNSKKL